jgi:hypothetical protein
MSRTYGSLDFEREMYWAVHEEECLAYVAKGATDHLRQGQVDVHGPWEPSACSARLLDWFDQGLIELYDDRKGHPSNRPDRPGHPSTRNGPTGTIPSVKARELLAAWAEWSDGGEPWRCTRLVSTDRGELELREPADPLV